MSTMPLGGARRSPLRLVSLLALLIALAVTGVATWGAHAAVSDQEHRLLKERTAEVALVLTQSIQTVPTSLAQQGAILSATNGSPSAYQQAASKAVAIEPGHPSFAWLRALPDGSYQVIAAAGGRLLPLQVVNDARVKAMDAAMHTTQVVPTGVIGKQRLLGFAMGPPAAPAGTVLYRETALGPAVTAPRAASSDPFSELDVALYASTRPDPATVLVSTTRDLPLTNGVRTTLLDVGTTKWLLSVHARKPLVGGLTQNAPWLLAIVGVVGSLLIALVVETAARRRDTAVSLYEAEHHVAETLQRSLLPQLPELPGLELAARYLASGVGQQVGGDWFDVFPVAGGRVGLAIGDVVGHNLTAASAMAQVRALLRGYALDGDDPAFVLTRLTNAVNTLQLTSFVTVFFALLDPPDRDGNRTITYANAGHIPPIMRTDDGTVEPLDDGDSVVIGVPIDIPHTQAQRRLTPDTTLVLFTDGLVEEPGGSLNDGLRELSTAIGSDTTVSPEELCDHLLESVSVRTRRDDVALLVVRLAPQQRRTAKATRPRAVSAQTR